jgi:non-ribosomal peptide synthetase component F
MVLLASLSLVLFFRTDQPDIMIGTLVANRRRKETEWSIGHFVNTVILRIRISPQMTFGELLNQVRDVTLAAYAHQELPFERLARVLEEERNIERSSLFQVLFMYQNITTLPLEMSGLTFAPLPTHQWGTDPNVMITSFDLVFDLREASTKLTGSVTYKKERFDNDDVTDLMTSLNKVLHHMTYHSERTISRDSLDEGT